jgi:hypothetical protein
MCVPIHNGGMSPLQLDSFDMTLPRLLHQHLPLLSAAVPYPTESQSVLTNTTVEAQTGKMSPCPLERNAAEVDSRKIEGTR